jgi:hypothetical protein
VGICSELKALHRIEVRAHYPEYCSFSRERLLSILSLSEHAIIDMFAKTYDSNIENVILIAIPKISENGRKLANHYEIRLIEAKTPEETIEKIKETLKQK